jgi:hypothetical protein
MTTGEINYNAYCEDRGWKSVRGDPLPKWHEQSDDLKASWEKAANAVLASVAAADTPETEAFSRPECIWNYCPNPEGCQTACKHPGVYL